MDKIKQYYTERDLEIILRHLKSGKVLDVGGGSGRLAIPLAKRGYDVTVVDTDEENLNKTMEKAQKEGVNIKTEVGDVKNLKFKDGSFDNVIAMRDVLNYCGDEYEKAFSEMARVCGESGKVIISSSSKYGYLFKNQGIDFLYDLIIRNKNFKSKEGFMFKAFTLRELEKLFKKFSVTLIESSGDSILMPLVKQKELEDFDLDKARKIDQKLSQAEGMLEFFDHLVLAGRKEKYIKF